MLITPEYQKLNEEKHQKSKDYGVSGKNYVQLVMRLADSLKTKDILDYGCGKGTLSSSIPFKIQEYDPSIFKHSQMPRPAELVVCTDVMEHVEEECVIDVLDHIKSLTRNMVLFTVSTKASEKHLSDGRNTHVTIRPYTWWLPLIWERFTIVSLDHQPERGFLLVGKV